MARRGNIRIGEVDERTMMMMTTTLMVMMMVMMMMMMMMVMMMLMIDVRLLSRVLHSVRPHDGHQ